MFISTIPNLGLEANMLLDLNKCIHMGSKRYEYHVKHIELVRRYMNVLNKKLDLHVNPNKLMFIAYSHDLLKEKGFNSSTNKTWKSHEIPQDLNRYIRTHLKTLENFGLEDYFNTDIQQHPLAAGIFLYEELGIRDPEVLYPIMFHSCPIIDVYQTLPRKTQSIVDITILADKLSSNYLRINYKHSEVRIDLDQVVFGSSGKEFNYSLGLFLARVIAQGNSTEKNSQMATDYYYKRLSEANPLIGSKIDSIKKIGGNKVWLPRKSKIVRMP